MAMGGRTANAPSSLNMHVNKVSRVYTIDLVAERLGVDVELLYRLRDGLEVEDGIITVYGLGDDDGVTSFTDYGIEQLEFLLEEYRSGELKLRD